MTDTATPVEEQSVVQPGDLTAKLKEYREKAGLDIEQAADEMHLSTNLLRALENEDFSQLPEPPYVRGYLRGYAKLADTNAQGLIRIYEVLRGAEPDAIAHHFAPARPISQVTQSGISPAVLKFIGFVLLALLLGLLSMIPGVRDWAADTWAAFSAQTTPVAARPAPALHSLAANQQAQTDETTMPPTPKPASESKATPPSQTPATTNTVDKPATPTTMSTADKPATPADQQIQTASTAHDPVPQQPAATTLPPKDAAGTDNQTETKPQQTLAPPAPVTQDTVTTATPSTPANADSATKTDAAAPTGATTPAMAGAGDATQTSTQQPAETGDTSTPTGDVDIKLEFTEEVWMQVKDNNKKTLFEALNSSGTQHEFKAHTPLSFKVGNARGVKIYLNGKPFDQAPYTKGSVARFKVE